MEFLEQFDFPYILSLYHEYIKNFDDATNYSESSNFFKMINKSRYIINQPYLFITQHPFRLKQFSELIYEVLVNQQQIKTVNDLREVVLLICPDYPLQILQSCLTYASSPRLIAKYLQYEKSFQQLEYFNKGLIQQEELNVQFNVKFLLRARFNNKYDINVILSELCI
ncbi:Hypothetical_protein [Hexamita inflata]|uniref:Hypothetical_protein n=1 Tax=Hexamita inflata TaxID=28002 RepID=A0AA86QQD6_9EUKA|nr:Hypothetical protein HINF_LOCUS12594 [Hexamita inflata]CAI9964036.1 Hypothetical protein HINF_LOCUS51681 [Hexamita inflata]